MSDYTQCNYCKLKAMKESAKRRKARIVLVSSTKMGSMGGVEVYEVRPGKKPNGRNWRCWFMGVPNSCCC